MCHDGELRHNAGKDRFAPKMQGQLQDPGALETIAHYLRLLEDAYLIAGCERPSRRTLRRRAAPPKVVVLNNALIAALDPEGMPDICMGVFDWALVVDHKKQESWLVSHGRHSITVERWQELIKLFSVLPEPVCQDKFKVTQGIRANLTKQQYAAALTAQTRPKRNTKGIAIVFRFLIPILVEIQGRPARQKIELGDASMQFLEQSQKNSATTLVSMNIVNKGGTYSRLKGNINVK